ncbi:MAG: DNA-deoxyinosine glycosylase [Clostridiales bacterium]|nr:DNA-deoxyinosine glycosylase [Clostridiales bacterium]
MADFTSVSHPFKPVWQDDSRILILGTFPSVRSRSDGFYYGHPQNRFWKVISALAGTDLPATIDEKIALLKSEKIALWDVLESCEIKGSSDQSIRAVIPNDLSSILKDSAIHTIYLNGQKAGSLYHRHLECQTALPAFILPSTSPANAAWSLNRLLDAWQVIK